METDQTRSSPLKQQEQKKKQVRGKSYLLRAFIYHLSQLTGRIDHFANATHRCCRTESCFRPNERFSHAQTEISRFGRKTDIFYIRSAILVHLGCAFTEGGAKYLYLAFVFSRCSARYVRNLNANTSERLSSPFSASVRVKLAFICVFYLLFASLM